MRSGGNGVVTTPFDPQQKEFTDTVFRDYRDLIFPLMFGVSKDAITYDQLPVTFMKEADSCIALDATIHTKFKGLRNAMTWTGSFRFRDAERYQVFQDLTLTEFNDVTGMLGELYKIAVDYFIYGYWSFERRCLVEVLVVHMHDFKRAIAREQIHPVPGHNPRSDQPFVGYRFEDLKRLGLVCLHLKEENGILVPQKRSIA
jgi:hypothetical protein